MEVTTTQRPPAPAELEAAVKEFDRLDNEIATLEEQLKELKAQRKQIGEHDIHVLVDGELLDTGCTFSDGSQYTFEQKVHASVTEANKVAARQWLEDKSADAMYKRYIILSLGKNSKEQAAAIRKLLAQVLPQYEIGIRVGQAPLSLVDAVRQLLDSAGLTPAVTVTEEVELPGPTLTSFVKKSLKAGVALPDCFGVYAPYIAVRTREPGDWCEHGVNKSTNHCADCDGDPR